MLGLQRCILYHFKYLTFFFIYLNIPSTGGGFAEGKICIGELEVAMVTELESIWSCSSSKKGIENATFYKPKEVPEGFYCLGHYGQPNNQPLHGFLLVAREMTNSVESAFPALQKPVDYRLIWSSFSWKGDEFVEECGYFWLPIAPEGYRSLGFVVTNGSTKPSLDSVRCVRSDLTDTCETHDLIADMEPIFPDFPCQFWKVRPCHRGMRGEGIPVGTFFCTTSDCLDDELCTFCLKNLDPSLQAMPDLEQVHSLINHYGPTVFFHPKEIYLPSSILWFFRNGATLYKKGIKMGEEILSGGSNLPKGGENDGEYWIDLPDDFRNSSVKLGNLESAELYVHVKPACGGTFTDIAMWVFCPFNGPATIKVGIANFPLSKIGQHVSDWEHFTLRISNFTGELWNVYFSQHSGGEWVEASDLEFMTGSNKPVVYSSKSGHASFPHPGNYLQGSEKYNIGVRNDTDRSEFAVDSSINYKIVAAEYLRDAVVEPCWLQYMREWGPKVTYDSTSELEKILSFLPFNLRLRAENILDNLPMELYGEEGPTGPKEKNNWGGDERC
jgi:Vacuolar protein sorting-associated protein 62